MAVRERCFRREVAALALCGDCHLPEDRSLSRFIPAYRPPSVEPRRTHRRRPRRPFGRDERIRGREVSDRFLHRMPVVGRAAVLVRLTRRRTAAAECLKVDERVIPAVHRDEQFPLFFRAALRDDTTHRVAFDARLLGVFVAWIFVVDHPPLGLEGRRLRFFGRETVMVSEVAKNLARLGGLERDAVERHHPFDRLFPPFRRRAAIGDACQPALLVGAVT